jgi:hypothetical protein
MIRAIFWGVLAGGFEYMIFSWEARRGLHRDRGSDDPLKRIHAVPRAVSAQMFAVYAAVVQGALFIAMALLDVPTAVAIPVFLGMALALALWQTKRERKAIE